MVGASSKLYLTVVVMITQVCDHLLKMRMSVIKSLIVLLTLTTYCFKPRRRNHNPTPSRPGHRSESRVVGAISTCQLLVFLSGNVPNIFLGFYYLHTYTYKRCICSKGFESIRQPDRIQPIYTKARQILYNPSHHPISSISQSYHHGYNYNQTQPTSSLDHHGRRTCRRDQSLGSKPRSRNRKSIFCTKIDSPLNSRCKLFFISTFQAKEREENRRRKR